MNPNYEAALDLIAEAGDNPGPDVAATLAVARAFLAVADELAGLHRHLTTGGIRISGTVLTHEEV